MLDRLHNVCETRYCIRYVDLIFCVEYDLYTPNLFYATGLYVRVDPRILANSTRTSIVPVTVLNVISCSELQECDLPSTHREDGNRPQLLVNTSLLWDTGKHAPNDDVLDFVGPRLYSYMRATTLAA